MLNFPENELGTWPKNDIGNATQFVAHFGAELKYVHRWQSWCVWDGLRWKKSGEGDTPAIQRATKLIEAWRQDSDRDVEEWGWKCGTRSRIASMIGLAQSSPEISADPDSFDRDPWQLSTKSGVYNLRTGENEGVNRAFMCTRIAPFEVAPRGTKAPKFMAFMNAICLGDEGLQVALLRWLGYCLTGVTSEQKFAIGVGVGKNGKTTLASLISQLLGDYAGDMPSSMLLTSQIEKGTSGLEALNGKRFVTCEEPDRKKELDREFIKRIVSGEPLQVSQKYEKPYDMRIPFKLFLMANHKPRVEFDLAFSRRVHLFPFRYRVPDEETNVNLVGELIEEEGPAILRLLIDQCLVWQELGLGKSETMATALESYREDFDPVGVFIEERCKVGEFEYVRVSNLMTAYNLWAKNERVPSLNRNSLRDALLAKGFETTLYGDDRLRHYKGLSLHHDV